MTYIPRLVLAVAVLVALGCEEADSPTAPPDIEQLVGFVLTGFNLTSVDAGDSYTCGLTKAGKAYCWGRNEFGELGNDNAPTNSAVPVAVAPPAGSTSPLTFAAVSAGGLHACALTAAGRAYCWGTNENGQLGNNDALHTTSDVPVAVYGSITFASVSAGTEHTCGLTPGGLAYCWGRNDSGQLGDDNAPSLSDAPVAVAPPIGSAAPLSFTSISAGTAHTCGVTASFQAYCWGGNQHGQLGDGNVPTVTMSDVPVPVVPPVGSTTPLTFASITGGDSHTCAAAKEGGRAYCWGNNSIGQLGNDNAGVDSDVPVPVAPPRGSTTPLTFASLSAGPFHTCGVTKNKGGVAGCWGANDMGRLGNGTNLNSNVPVAVANGAMTFTSVTAGGRHTCGVAKGKGAWCWGDNFYGQLGNDEAPIDNFAPSPVQTP